MVKIKKEGTYKMDGQGISYMNKIEYGGVNVPTIIHPSSSMIFPNGPFHSFPSQLPRPRLHSGVLRSVPADSMQYLEKYRLLHSCNADHETLVCQNLQPLSCGNTRSTHDSRPTHDSPQLSPTDTSAVSVRYNSPASSTGSLPRREHGHGSPVCR